MSDSAVDRVMKGRKPAEGGAASGEADKFFSIMGGDGLAENFLELQFRNGLRTAFSYTDLQWFSWDPDAPCMDLEFGGFLITIKGRGLYPTLFQAIKNRRVAWVKEADSEMQDHDGNDAFVAEITIIAPKGFTEESSAG